MFSILAFDCGIKNMGVARLTMRVNAARTDLTYEFECRCVDLTSHGTSFEDMTSTLKGVLTNIPSADVVLVERQPRMIGKFNVGEEVALLSAQIMYHYAGRSRYIMPKLKDDVRVETHVSCNINTSYDMTLSQKYSARKKHSIVNFMSFLSKHNIRYDGPKKKDDIADAFMMIWAWITFNGHTLIFH